MNIDFICENNINIEMLKMLPTDLFNFLIKVCKIAIKLNIENNQQIGNKLIISKIYDLFLSFNLNTTFIEFPTIVCKPKKYDYIKSYEQLYFREKFHSFKQNEIRILSKKMNVVKIIIQNYNFKKFDNLFNNDIFSLQNITDTNKNISTCLLTFNYKNSKNIINNISSILNYRYKYIGTIGEKNLYITDKFEGNLNLLKLRTTMSDPNLLLTIVEEIRKQIISIFKFNLNYVFINMNLENILYKCNNYEPEKISVYLNLDFSNNFTYPPPEYKYVQYYNEKLVFNTKEEKEGLLSWNIGILLLLLIDNGSYVSNFFYPNIKHHNSINIEKAKRKIIEFYGFETYANYLDIKPLLRPSIYQPLI